MVQAIVSCSAPLHTRQCWRQVLAQRDYLHVHPITRVVHMCLSLCRHATKNASVPAGVFLPEGSAQLCSACEAGIAWSKTRPATTICSSTARRTPSGWGELRERTTDSPTEPLQEDQFHSDDSWSPQRKSQSLEGSFQHGSCGQALAEVGAANTSRWPASHTEPFLHPTYGSEGTAVCRPRPLDASGGFHRSQVPRIASLG